MRIVVDVIVIGLQTGAMYALVALGIALVFKATKVLNFAHGEIGTSAAFLTFWIWRDLLDGLGLLGAEGQFTSNQLLLATVPAVIFGALLGLATAFVLRFLAKATPVTNLVATVGVGLFLVAWQIRLFEAEGQRFPRFIEGNLLDQVPGGTLPLSWHTVLILLVLGGAAILLAGFFKTPPGVALLATSQDPAAAELQGISVRRMTALAWTMAGALAAVAGLLGAGVFNQLTPGLMLSTFLIPAFAGALLGGITSMPGSVLGGLVLGVLVAAANQINQSLQLGIGGTPQIAVLVSLLLVLLFRPRGLLGQAA